MKRKNIFKSRSPQTHKIRQRPRRDIVHRTSEKFKTKMITITAVSIIAAVLLLGLIGRQRYLGSAGSVIQQAVLDTQSLNTHQNPWMISTVQTDLIGRSRRRLKWFEQDELIAERKSTNPWIDNISFSGFEDNILTIHVEYHPLALAYQLPGNRWYGSLDEHILQVHPDDTILSGALIVDLPGYTESFGTIDGIYYQISETELVGMIQQIITVLGEDSLSEIIYLPGGQKLFLGYKSKRLYIHLNKDITSQLYKLQELEENYPQFGDLAVLDLGSTDNVIVE